ncbi:Fur family transcriptional regulator [Salinispira pacifica]
MKQEKRNREGDPGSRLTAGGYRSTEPRRLLIELLSSTEECLTAEDLYLGAHHRNPRIGLTTVYRTLALLYDLGEVSRVEAGDGKARYELSEHSGAEHHHHLICAQCRRIRRYAEFSSEELELMRRTESALEKRFGYRITGHSIYFHGICPACAAKGDGGGRNA